MNAQREGALVANQRPLQDVAVVVLSHNRREELAVNLSRLERESKASGLRVVIVDNASTDGSDSICQELAKRNEEWQYVQMKTNTGVAGGRNAGLARSGRQFTLNVDDDTRIGVEAIEALRNYLVEHPSVAVVSPLVRHPDTGRIQNNPRLAKFGVQNYHGSCHMFRTEVIEALGGVDRLCSFGGEELDTSVRVRAAGYEVSVVPSLLVEHNSQPRESAEDRRRRLLRCWNFPRILAKHFPLRIALQASLRLALAHIRTGVPEHGTSFAFEVVASTFRGFRVGRRESSSGPLGSHEGILLKMACDG
jgi:GT2 family glycosyltransferase